MSRGRGVALADSVPVKRSVAGVHAVLTATSSAWHLCIVCLLRSVEHIHSVVRPLSLAGCGQLFGV
eukprot:9876413-Lingulodinium_polyedra.AAC.1